MLVLQNSNKQKLFSEHLHICFNMLKIVNPLPVFIYVYAKYDVEKILSLIQNAGNIELNRPPNIVILNSIGYIICKADNTLESGT